jgi:hypothetical protein
MPHKKVVLWFLAGWLFSMLFGPQHVMSLFTKRAQP